MWRTQDETRSRKEKQSQLPSHSSSRCPALTALLCHGPASPLAANSCRCENLMYKYNLPHTQTLMWPPTGRRQLPVEQREKREEQGAAGGAGSTPNGSQSKSNRQFVADEPQLCDPHSPKNCQSYKLVSLLVSSSPRLSVCLAV